MEPKNKSNQASILTVDVAHPPLPADQVEALLLESWSRVRNSENLRVVKFIHGYGSSGKGGSTRELVRNWAFHHRSKFRDVIEGEAYHLLNPSVQEMRRELETFTDADLQHPNEGITILWVK
jgi:hypothetical protein